MLLDEFLVVLCGLWQRLLVSEVEGFLCGGDPVEKSLDFLSLRLQRRQAAVDLLALLLSPRLNLTQETGKGREVRPVTSGFSQISILFAV